MMAPEVTIDSSLSRLAAKFQQASALHQSGEWSRARTACEEILRIQPKHAESLHLLGLIDLQTGNPKRAAVLFGKVLAVDPGHAPAHCNRGSAFKDLGQWDAAMASYNQALVLVPGFAEAHHNRGLVFQQLEQWDAALASHNQAIACNAGWPEPYFGRGNVLWKLGLLDAALASFDQAIAINPNFAEAYCNRGALLKVLNRLDAALASYDQAIACRPSYAEAFSNRGNVLRELGQFDAAMASFDRAIALKPDLAQAYCNRGNLRSECNSLDAALTDYARAIALRPDHAEAHCNRAVALLLAGDLEKGWIEYEWRLARNRSSSGSTPKNHADRRWRGRESLAGKTILLRAEQGYGDTLQFCRYAKQVAELNAIVVMEVQPPLLALLASLEGVSQLIAQGSTLPHFDYQSPLLSLPLAFKTSLTTIPCSRQYLRSDPGKVASWRERLGERIKPRIGLAWSGSTIHRNNNRPISLADLIRHLPEDFQYVSLQKEISDADRRELETGCGILNFADELSDFSDTAALVECLDLVISIDTSVAHLAGALGKTTCILLAFNPDWRWLLKRDDSPWYPTAKLYRQASLGQWNDVLERVKADLVRTFPKVAAMAPTA